MLTADQLKEIESQTKAGWEYEYLDGNLIIHDSRYQVCCGRGISECCLNPECAGEYYKVAEFEKKEDAEGYFYSRQNLPRLITAYREQQEELEHYKRALYEACEIASQFSEYGGCDTCPAAGKTCTEGDCAADLCKYVLDATKEELCQK